MLIMFFAKDCGRMDIIPKPLTRSYTLTPENEKKSGRECIFDY